MTFRLIQLRASFIKLGERAVRHRKHVTDGGAELAVRGHTGCETHHCSFPPVGCVVFAPAMHGGLPGHLFLICELDPAGNISYAGIETGSLNSPPMPSKTAQRLLELMVARIGPADVARRLQVPSAVLNDWLSGKSALPDITLLALIDLIDETSDGQ